MKKLSKAIITETHIFYEIFMRFTNKYISKYLLLISTIYYIGVLNLNNIQLPTGQPISCLTLK